MLSKKELSEIREHLERSQNPVFFYDNDADGLCSFVLMRRFIGRGKGVAVRTHPALDPGYAKKAQELNADYIFVLDRPYLGEDFVKEIEGLQLPIVWIDHHSVESGPEIYRYKNISYYNPVMKPKSSAAQKKWKQSSEPVTYWCYKSLGRKEDAWLAVIGCISDHYMPSFAKSFAKDYPEYWGEKSKIAKPFDAYYGTEIGRLARALAYGLKDSVTHIIYLQNCLINATSPADVFLDLESKSSFAKKYKEISTKYNSLFEKAQISLEDKFVFFSYGGTLSISSELSNQLSYIYPKSLVVVAYKMDAYSNISIRGRRAKEILDKILPDFENANGGGHQEAVGARVQTKDLERFKKAIEQNI